MGSDNSASLGITRMRRMPKILIHEHLDCSLRPRTMIELWEKIGFDRSKIPFPLNVTAPWQSASLESGPKRRQLRAQAVKNYEAFLVEFARQSLANYIEAIVGHVLPLMQSQKNLTRITRERIEDAQKDGIIAMELRFAPQLHTLGGLLMEEVMEAVIAATNQSPFPLKLIICALRHEDADMARSLADLILRYRRHVGVFDLAGDEDKYPGVLEWWLKEAIRVRDETDGAVAITIHLTETRKATPKDKVLIRENKIGRIGHGIKDDWSEVREVCPTSNVITGQTQSIKSHPINSFYKAAKPVTVNTDGTLFTQVQLTDEYLKLEKAFGWKPKDFLTVNLTALECSSFSKDEKTVLKELLLKGYKG